MSVSFTKSPVTYIEDLSVSYTTPLTISFSGYIEDPTSDSFPFLVQVVENSTGYQFACLYALSINALRPRYEASAGGNAVTILSSAAAQWFDVCLIAYDTSMDAWVNGSQIFDSQSYGSSISFSGVTFDEFRIGGKNSNELDGNLANVALWNTSITDDQSRSLSNGISPLVVRPQDLELYVAGISSIDRDEMQNISLSAPVSSPSLSASDNPKIIFPE